VRLASQYFTKGAIDNMPSGSYILPDFKSNLNRLENGGNTSFPVKTGTGVYLNWLSTQNNWYSTTAYAMGFGSGSTPTTGTLTTSLRGFGAFQASQDCRLESVEFSFLLYKTSTGALDLDIEFSFMKLDVNNDSGTIGTMTEILPSVSIDDTFRENKSHYKTASFRTNDPQAPQINAHDMLGVFIRCTNQSSIRVYGGATLKINLL